jgi:hypothetical protein
VRARELDDVGDSAVVEAEVGGEGRRGLDAVVGAAVLLDQAFELVVDAAGDWRVRALQDEFAQALHRLLRDETSLAFLRG